MDADLVYTSPLWRRTRELALERDGHRCTVARLLGGECSGSLHAHHILKLTEGGAPYDTENVGTTCAHHHPMWEALRRQLVERLLGDGPPTCRHDHRSAEARRQCEARMIRRRSRALLAA